MDLNTLKKTIGIFSKLGMPGGSENRVLQLANSFSERVHTYIFAEKSFSPKLKSKLNHNVILRENSVFSQKTIHEMSGVDKLIVVNSDSYSFCKPAYWNGKQGKHHKNDIDISQIETLAFLFNYVVSPAKWLANLHEVNPNIKIMTTSDWFTNNINTENKFEKLRKLNLPIQQVNSPVSIDYAQEKIPSDKIRINRHSMAFSYKHDQENIIVVNKLCEKYGDKISFHWVGVPSDVRNIHSDDKNARVSYRRELEKHEQVKTSKEYSIPIPKLLSETDIMLFYISRYRKEPWPRTVAESMMAGCCCVTNNNYGMAEQIKSGETGFLFNDTAEAIKQLSDLIENPDKIKEIGAAAQDYAKSHFLDSIVTNKMLEFIC